MGRLIDGAIDITSQNKARLGGIIKRPRSNTKYLIIHYTAGGSISSAVSTLNKKGLAYHFLIDKNGTVYVYTPDNIFTQHAGNINNESVSIAFVGGGPDYENGPYLGERDILRRPSQINVGVQLGEELIAKYGIKRENIFGHGELPGAGKLVDEGITTATRLRGGTPKAQLPPDAGKPSDGGGSRGSLSTSTAPQISKGPNPFDSAQPVSPYIASVESFHPYIQYELTRRRNSEETANVYMPFVRLTSLSTVLKSNLREGSITEFCKTSPDTNNEAARINWINTCVKSDTYCPSLGIHGNPNVSFDDIYSPVDKRSIVGYASQLNDGTITRVPVVVANEEKDPPNIPPPGIVSLNTERSTAGPMGVRGGLFKATVNIRAYSVGQVDTLLRYFLRPATRVVLELGRKSSNINEEYDDSNVFFKKFDWLRPLGTESDGNDTTISGELGPLVTLKKGQRDFIEKYIYGNLGNYEIFIGYVVKFDLKFTKENSYDIKLVIHSLQQYEVPVNGTGVNSLNPSNSVPNPCDAVDIIDYFNPPSGWRANTLKKLMTEGKGSTNYSTHIVELTGPGTNATSGGSESPGWMVTWQFFVDIMLNDTEQGILSVFQLDNNDEKTKEFLKSSVIRPIQRLTTGSRAAVDANEVSWSPSLRSVDPNVMIIYNAIAQQNTIQTNAEAITGTLESLGDISKEQREDIVKAFNTSNVQRRITEASPVGAFTATNDGTSYLTRGVWINTNAIINAFSGADTITTAINNLLTAMNNATRGFWNLQLLSNDTDNPGLHVIDAGLSKKPQAEKRPEELDVPRPMETDIINTNIGDDAIPGIVTQLKLGTKEEGRWKPNYLYVFNRKLQTTDEGDTGSELLDVSVESSLPQVVAVQAIAGVGGQMQRGTLNSIDIDELRSIALYDVYPKNKDDKITPCNPVPTGEPQLPKDIETDFIEVVRATLRGKKGTFRGSEVTAEDINSVQQTLIDEWKSRNASVCPEGEDDPKKLEECEKAVAERTKLYEEVRGKLGATVRETFESGRPGYLSLVRQYSGTFGQAIDLIEYDVSKLSKLLDVESQIAQEEGKPHSFNSSNLTKTLVNLTMPGIGGIQLFQSFAVDRIPSILDRGYYVVTKVDHEFSTDNGWITKIQGRFRYNPPTKPVRVAQRTPPTTPPATPTQPRVTARTIPLENFTEIVKKSTNQELIQLRVTKVSEYRNLKLNTYSITYRQGGPVAQKRTDDAMIKLTQEITLINAEIEKRIVDIITRNKLGNNVVPPPFTGYNRVNPVADWLTWVPRNR